MGWSRWFSGCMMLLFLFSAADLSAQTWAELFKQNKTQKKYLLNQIAALQVYIGYARKGYALVGNGLETVRDISQGEFSLHNAFISALSQVSPVVRQDVRVAEIISMQLSVLKCSASWADHELLTAENRDYISGVRGNLIGKCLMDLEELLLVMTSGKVEMGDQERLRRIAVLYDSMSGHLGFARKFTAEVNLLVSSHELELLELEKIKERYGEHDEKGN